MPKRVPFILCTLFAAVIAQAYAQNQRPQRLDIEHADLLEILLGDTQDTTIATGSVYFRTESGTIACDSAIWIKGRRVILRGSVILEDAAYRLMADSVDYNLLSGVAEARGPYVELWSRSDSIFAVGTRAFYDRPVQYFKMENRPTLYLNYPDSAEMVEVVGDQLEYRADSGLAISEGKVVITSRNIRATAGRAVSNRDKGLLELYEQPQLERGKSTVRGRFIAITSQDNLLDLIRVTDSARAEFKEPVDTLDSTAVMYDESVLTGRSMTFDFEYGVLRTVQAVDQAYSWYYPYSRGSDETSENKVSGDTITFDVRNDELRTVRVVGGAVGTYVNMTTDRADTSVVTRNDTIDYKAQYITYDLEDSVITLVDRSHVESGAVELDAYQVRFETQRRLIKAYSADITKDSAVSDSTLTTRFQPNPIPVVLKDGTEELLGDYLEFSIDTEKGRIVQSKSAYETGFYYGESVYRAQEHVFYVESGRYTTCNASDPHFHFFSNHMKFIQDDKLIAKPVVLNIGRLPILALPYYVFPLKKGRHSGILPFRFGNIEQGERYVENVGYYWAPSDYWDIQSALGYHERRSALTLGGQFRYKQLYAFTGSVNGNFTKETDYDQSAAAERQSTRWNIRAAHDHEFSPTFKLTGSGQYVSDKSYYSDYSIDLRDRLNNNITGRVSLQKRFSRSISLSGAYSHTDYLKQGRRIDQLENFGLSLPLIRPFGSGRLDADGQLQTRWYNNFTVTPTARASFTSERNTRDSSFVIDTNVVIDTVGGIIDTISTVIRDTISNVTRRKVASSDYVLSANLPLKAFQYINVNPSFSYRENWAYVFETDLSRAAGIEPDLYRTFIYSAGVSASTNLYGTVAPNILGLIGLRQVLTPSVSYNFTPDINRHPQIRAYARAGYGAVARSQTLSFALSQLYQAKIRGGEAERTLDLLTVGSSFGYNFEADTLPLSPLSTSISSNVLPRINLNASMSHSFYRPTTGELRLWNPFLLSFDLTASFAIRGSRFLFDDDTPVLGQGADSAAQLSSPGLDVRQSSVTKGWDLTMSYRYSESGIGHSFRKSSFLQFDLRFMLTPTTSVAYAQYYDISRGLTINNQVSFAKQLHCWTGTFYWVPVGSNRGWGFRLYVTALPEIKIDNNNSQSVSGGFINRGF